MAAMAQARPMPRNTFTALEPVTLPGVGDFGEGINTRKGEPMDESAVLSWMAAVFEAKVSGGENGRLIQSGFF